MNNIILIDCLTEENLRESNLKSINTILKEVFYLESKKPIIDFLNKLYDYKLGYNSEIIYLDKENINSEDYKKLKLQEEVNILIIDGNREIEFRFRFQNRRGLNIDIRVVNYIINLNIEPEVCEEYVSYLFALEEDKKLPEEYNFIVKTNGLEYPYITKVIRYWDYSIDTIYKNNMYLLVPLKLINLKKKLSLINKNIKGNLTKKSKIILDVNIEINKIIDDIKKSINKMLQEELITFNDYNSINNIVMDVFNYYNASLGNLLEIKEISLYNEIISICPKKIDEYL